MPAVSAWAAFLLCRHLAGRFWPSLIGGYLFGFSSYELGLPLVVIVALYARSAWRTPLGRFLLAALALAVYVSLGPKPSVYGHRTIPLPTLLGHNAGSG